MTRFAIAVGAFLLSAIGLIMLLEPENTAPRGLPVATSISPIADIIKQVGGGKVSVTTLVPLGTDPHDFEPKPSDVASVSRAKIFFANGVGEESYLQRLLDDAKGTSVRTVILSDGLRILDKGQRGFGDVGNPHLWLSPENGINYAKKIRQTLAVVDPANKRYYDDRCARYINELESIDRWTSSRLSRIPPDKRKLVVFHNAWSYFAQRYGFSVIAIVSGGEEAEPSAASWKALLQRIRDEKIQAVFGEKGLGQRITESLARDAGVAYVEPLLSDTLSAEHPSYAAMLRNNTELIVEGLK